MALFAESASFENEDELDSDDEDDDSDDEDDDDDDDDDLTLSSSARYSSGSTSARSPFTGLKLDPWDPNPLIKPRPSRYFKEEKKIIPDDQLVQTMSQDERGENLKMMRQIKKNDIKDLRLRRDYAGWVDANNDLKRRFERDPWFGINERLKEAIQMGEPEEKVEHLKKLAERVGGPPPGITVPAKGYVVYTDIYDIGISPSRAAAVMERHIREERAARGKLMMAERLKNQEKEKKQYEEDRQFPGMREEKEARERRERTMRRLLSEIEEENKKKAERAKELLGKVPDMPETRTKAMEKALEEAREEVKKIRRKELGKAPVSSLALDGAETPTSGAAAARALAASEATGGRPRLPGDEDITSGMLGDLVVEPASTTVTGPLKVEVTSTYNYEQSDPPMRKHCFQYTIRITNNSDKDTIQLLGRRFEIQTVASSMKDVVQGEGVTGRTPILKPGEVFEYTSTAPLSVRAIATTIIAARMKGEYRYVVLKDGQDTATEEQIKSGGGETAELGMFHFIFPEDQRVQPFRSADYEDDEDEDDEDEDDDDAPVAEKKAVTTTKTTTATPVASSYPSSSLPGDQDMVSGDITCKLNDASDEVTDEVRVTVNSSYRPERSDEGLDKHVFAYNIRITNESKNPIQLVSRRFEIQTIGSANKDVVQGAGVTGRQPILKPGESFEYTSTAPLNVKPMSKTPVVGRMQGDYSFVRLQEDGTTPVSSEALKAKLGLFHFVLPALT
jgi:ApaG protein